jgi:hypothetical protein
MPKAFIRYTAALVRGNIVFATEADAAELTGRNIQRLTNFGQLFRIQANTQNVKVIFFIFY